MSNLSIENLQFNKQKTMLSYQAVIIVIHGLDFSWIENWAKMMLMTSQLFLPYNIKFILPQAPAIPVDLNIDGHPGPKTETAWYNIISLEDLESGENDRGLLESIKWIEKLIKKEVNEGIHSQNIFIAGFSQGGSVALAISMISQYELGGFVSLAGFVPYPKVLKKVGTKKNKEAPIFMVHGQRDKLVPYEKAQKSFQILQQSGYRVETIKVYPELGHEPLHFLPMVIEGLGFLNKIFQKRNFPKLSSFNPENVVIVRKEKIQLDIEVLISARNFLERALQEAKTELEIAGSVQAFEVCYELTWKTCKKILSLQGINANSPKETFRKAGLEGLISNSENWFYYAEKRNITVHEYEQNILEEVYPILPSFLKDLDLLIRNLKKL